MSIYIFNLQKNNNRLCFLVQPTQRREYFQPSDAFNLFLKDGCVSPYASGSQSLVDVHVHAWMSQMERRLHR